MDRFYCYLVGFAIALALVAGFCAVKSVVDQYKEKAERRVNQLAEVVFYEELQKVIGYYPCSLAEFVDKRIDQRLAEKEGGEHESD